jgi:hypothetical protein
VLHHTTGLATSAWRVHPVIACEREPADGDLVRACRDHGIAIVWLERFADRLAEQNETKG